MMHPVLAALKMAIDLSPHTYRTAALEAGLAHDTVRRWMDGSRRPKLDDVARVLQIFDLNLAVTAVPKAGDFQED